jgi:hypothetical protein
MMTDTAPTKKISVLATVPKILFKLAFPQAPPLQAAEVPEVIRLLALAIKVASMLMISHGSYRYYH